MKVKVFRCPHGCTSILDDIPCELKVFEPKPGFIIRSPVRCPYTLGEVEPFEWELVDEYEVE